MTKLKSIQTGCTIGLLTIFICGMLGYFYVSLLTPPPPGPTDIPNGASLRSIAQAYPGEYSARKDYQSLPDARKLSQEERKTFTGDVVIINHPKKDDNVTLTFVNGTISSDSDRLDLIKLKLTLDACIKRQNSKTSLKYSRGSATFNITLPQDLEKLNGFSGEITTFTKDMWFGLNFELKDGTLVNSRKWPTLAWD